MTAMILAAGLGTRLRPLTDELPKPLVPVGDAPAVVHIARQLARAGAARLVLNTHHLAPAFATVDWPLPVTLEHEPRIRGTAGGVAGVRARLDPAAPVLLWNGDIVADVAASRLLDALAGSDAVAAWAVAPRARGEGTVGLDEQGRVVRLRHVRCGVEARGGDFIGVQALSPGLLPALPAEGCLVGDVLAPLLERGATLATVDHAGPWDDIGSVAAYLAANQRWLRERGLDTFRAPGSDAPDAHGCVVGAGASASGRLERVVLWPGARAVGPLADAVVTTGGLVVR